MRTHTHTHTTHTHTHKQTHTYRGDDRYHFIVATVCLHPLLQVYWGSVLEGTALTVNNAENSSSLLSEEEYIIGDLSPLDQVSALVIAISYVGSKSEGVELAKGETYGKGM